MVLLVRPRLEEPTDPIEIVVLHEDALVLAVDKPAGLPMHPTATYHRYTLTFALRERYGAGAPHIAHRLDRETSGVVLCGKTVDAERSLKRAFEARQVKKTYLAIVRGRLDAHEGVVDVPLGRAIEGLHVLMRVDPEAGGLPARTRYRVIERAQHTSLLSLEPETGRQHQLRVHLASIGHPIVGDKLYGPDGVEPFLEHIETGMTDALRMRLGHDRHALHAHEVRFAHPATGAPTTITSALPADLRGLWAEVSR